MEIPGFSPLAQGEKTPAATENLQRRQIRDNSVFSPMSDSSLQHKFISAPAKSAKTPAPRHTALHPNPLRECILQESVLV